MSVCCASLCLSPVYSANTLAGPVVSVGSPPAVCSSLDRRLSRPSQRAGSVPQRAQRSQEELKAPDAPDPDPDKPNPIRLAPAVVTLARTAAETSHETVTSTFVLSESVPLRLVFEQRIRLPLLMGVLFSFASRWLTSFKCLRDAGARGSN